MQDDVEHYHQDDEKHLGGAKDVLKLPKLANGEHVDEQEENEKGEH